MQRYRVQASTNADPATVFAMLLDGPGWREWMAVDEVVVEAAATATRGEMRRIVSGGHVSRERAIEIETDRRFVYVNESPPFTAYRGEITLAPLTDRQTLITWSGAFTIRPAILGWAMRLYLRRFMQRTVDQLARAAERPRYP